MRSSKKVVYEKNFHKKVCRILSRIHGILEKKYHISFLIWGEGIGYIGRKPSKQLATAQYLRGKSDITILPERRCCGYVDLCLELKRPKRLGSHLDPDQVVFLSTMRKEYGSAPVVAYDEDDSWDVKDMLEAFLSNNKKAFAKYVFLGNPPTPNPHNVSVARKKTAPRARKKTAPRARKKTAPRARKKTPSRARKKTAPRARKKTPSRTRKRKRTVVKTKPNKKRKLNN